MLIFQGVSYDNLRRIRKIPDKIMVLHSVKECELDSFLEKAKKKGIRE